MRKIESEKYMEVWQFICKYRMTHGISPSMRDIMENVEIGSTSTVTFYAEGLAEHGWVRNTPEISRGYVPTNEVVLPPPDFVRKNLCAGDQDELLEGAVYQLLEYVDETDLRQIIDIIVKEKELLNEQEPTY